MNSLLESWKMISRFVDFLRVLIFFSFNSETVFAYECRGYIYYNDQKLLRFNPEHLCLVLYHFFSLLL